MTNGHRLRWILAKIRCNSFASCHSGRAFPFIEGSAAAIILMKCFVSRASFLHVPMFLRNSFFDTASFGLAVIRADARATPNELID